ncbi:MAG TPA: porin [Terriglobales bacterium]|nr:porin [Terriglobales bacterium]
MAVLAVLAVVLVFGGVELNAQPLGADPEMEKADLLLRLAALEKEVAQLRLALATVNAPHSEPGTEPAAPAATPAAASAVTTPVESTAHPVTISGLLGSTTLSGFVDLNYGFNFNQPASRTTGLRSFDAPANQFALNMVELVADKPAETASRFGYHVALGFGNAMNAVNASDPGGLGFAQYLKEAYLSYMVPVGSGLTFDFGKFVTPHGAEVIESKDNWNYSRGLLFSWAIPYYHFGARAKYAFNSKYAITGYLVNGWNNVLDNNTGKTLGVSFAWTPSKKFGITQNYMAGPEGLNTNSHWRQLSDTVVTFTPSSRLSLMLNYDYGRGDYLPLGTRPVFWTGVGGYVRYAFDSRYAVATRYEYYDDHDGFTTGTPQHLHEVTQTVERLIGKGLITRLELRHDSSTAPVFMKGTVPVSRQTTLAAGMIYQFTTHQE